MFQQGIFITQEGQVFLGAFAYSRKAPVTSIMSVCLSVCLCVLAPTGWILCKFLLKTVIEICRGTQNLVTI
jgi:hypothetical protein